MNQELNSTDQERIKFCIRTIREIADLGRDNLGDLYPQALLVLGTLKQVLEPNGE